MALRDKGLQPDVRQGLPEGAMPQPAPEPTEEEVNWVEDALLSFGGAAVESFAGMVGGVGDLNNNAGAVASYALQLAGMDKEKADTWGLRLGTTMFPGAALIPGSDETQEMVPEGVHHDPQTWQGEIAARAGTETPYMLAMPGAGSLVNRGMSVAGSAFGGQGGEWVGEKVADFGEGMGMDPSWRPYIEGAGDVAGSVMGSFAPNYIKNKITPNPMDDERRRLAASLERRGVESSAGQRTGNDNLLVKEEATTGWDDIQRRQRDQYTRATLDETGFQGGSNRADPRTLGRQREILQGEFERLQSYGIEPDTQFFGDLVQVRDAYLAETPNRPLGRIVDTVNELADRGQRGIPIDGEWLKNKGTQLRKAREKLRASNPVEAGAIDDLIEVIDDAVERTMQNVAPDDIGRFQEVRRLYRNLITVEEAAAGSTTGQLTPADLTRATKKMETRRGYARGFGPLNELSREGDEIIYRVPDSGTTRRAANKFSMMDRLTSYPGGIGAGLGYMVGAGLGHPGFGAAAGGMIGGAINEQLQRLRLTPQMQQYLANQVATGWTPHVGAAQRALVGGATAGFKNKEEY